MTAEPAPSTRTVVLRRADRYYAPGYWTTLVACKLRMPAGVVGGRSYEGLLVAADEDGEDEITLTFEDCAPEVGG